MFIGLNSAITGLTQDQLSKTINSLFSKNEQGVWYDPSDFSTMFQDAAGTTPVTGMEQPVGRILDKSGRGNHATQTTTTSRPVLSARVNLLTNTEAFNDASWAKFTIGSSTVLVTDNFGIAPDGNQTATRLQMTGSGGFAELFQRLPVNIGVQYTVSIWMRSLAGTKQTTIFGPSPYSSLVTVTEQWQRFSFTVSAIGSRLGIDIIVNVLGASASLDILIWHPDIRATNTGIGLPAYQRVNTATDYDTAGFPMYLLFDGVDDYLSTGSIDFTGTDKMTVFAGVRKLSDAARGVVAELSTSSANSGMFVMDAPNALLGNYSFATKGNGGISVAQSNAGTFVEPITNVVAGISDISGDSVILRVNGNQVAQSTADQGTGNYGNYPLYIGRRGGTSLPFNGQLYGLVIRGALSSTGEIQGSESYMNLHTGAY